MLCVEALVFQQPGVLVVALALVVLGIIGHPWSPVGWLFRAIAPPPRDLEPRAPVRFSQGLAVIFLGLACLSFLAGLPVVGWVLAGAVAALALLASIFGVCVGCHLYRLLPRGKAPDDDVRSLLSLSGSGPWVVVLTAPGCSRCGPVVDAVSEKSDGAATIVDLVREPAARALPVKSVPAVLRVGVDGAISETLTGHIDDSAIDGLLSV